MPCGNAGRLRRMPPANEPGRMWGVHIPNAEENTVTYADPNTMGALIVEEGRGVDDLGAMMRSELDLHVDQVSDAEAALAHLRERGGATALMVADVHLPGSMDGLALARSVCVLWPSISVILTSDTPLDMLPAFPERAVYVARPWRALDIVSAAERAARADHSVHAVRL